MTAMRTLFSIIFSFSLMGCGSTTSFVKVDIAPVYESTFKFVDNRPDEIRKARVDKDESGTTFYYSDDNLLPTAPQLVTAVLQTELRDELAGHTVTLNEFILYVYDHSLRVDESQMYASTSGIPNGVAVAPVAMLLLPSIDGIVGEKNVYVRISGTVDEQSFSTFSGDIFRGSVTEKNIQKTLKKTLALLAKDLRSLLTKD